MVTSAVQLPPYPFLRRSPSAAVARRSCRRPPALLAASHGREGDPAAAPVLINAENRRAEPPTPVVASGELGALRSGLIPALSGRLSKLGPTGRFFGELLLSGWSGGGGEDRRLEIPEIRGSFDIVGQQAFFVKLYETFLAFGGIFRITFGPKSIVIVSDPAIAKHILRDNSKAYSKGILSEILEFVMGKGLIPADGEVWRVRRRAIVPALHQKYVSAMISLFSEASNRLCEKLDVVASQGADVDMESLFSRLTLDVIGKAVFNYDFDSLRHDNGIVEAIYLLLREAEIRSTSPIPIWDIPIWKDFSPRLKKVNAALKLVNETLDGLIAICKGMVEQEELQFHEEYMNEQDPTILHFLIASGDDVSSKQLRDDLMTLLIAGHETSAAVLTWTFYLLSKDPKVMSKLQDEVDFVLGDRFPTIEDVKKLKYTTRVICESLRLYPQPPILIRRSLEDDMLGEYPIKRGEDIFISVWNIHHCHEHWVDAERFNPERWPLDGPNPNEINQNYSYLPFGAGPRKCVGDTFAMYENVVATAMLARRFNFEMALSAPPVEMTTGATIHTKAGLNMTVTHRTERHATTKLGAEARGSSSAGGDQPAGVLQGGSNMQGVPISTVQSK